MISHDLAIFDTKSSDMQLKASDETRLLPLEQ